MRINLTRACLTKACLQGVKRHAYLGH